MATSITWPPIGGASFSVPAAGEVGWPALSNYLIALQNAQGTEAQKIGVRRATTSPVTVASTDCVIKIKLTIAGASTVNLPAGVTGQYLVIVDETGDASTNNITIVPNGAETINGAASLVISADRGSYVLQFSNSNWSITGFYSASVGGTVLRSQIATATPNYVVINSGTGALSEEAQLAQSRGGFGANVSAYTGYVKATAGVFSASAIAAADLPTAIDAAKIANGSVSNTEFQYLDGATSNIQAQITAITGSGITSLTGEVTATGPGAAAATIANGVITNAKISASAAIALSKLATQAANTVVANVTGGAAVPTAVALTSAATASAVMIRDANANVAVNNLLQNYATTATAAGTTVLTVGSSPLQFFTGTTTQTVTLPVASTLVLGQQFCILNRSTGLVTVNSSGGNLVGSVNPNTALWVTCILTSGTTAASWDALASSSASSGSGVKNYFSTAASNSAIGWIASGAGITVTTETTSTNFPDNITQTSAVKILRASGADYAAYRFTMDAADYAWLCAILWDFKYAGTAGDYTLSLFTNTASNYGGTYTSVTLPTTSIASTGTGSGKFQTSGISGALGTQYMELRINGISGTTPLYLNNVVFTPNGPAQGAAVSEWQSYTPTIGNLPGTPVGYWRRVGSQMEINITMTATGAATGQITTSIPSGYSISSQSTATAFRSSGIASASVAGVNYTANAQVLTSTTLRFFTNGGTAVWAATVPGTWANGSTIEINASFPIAEWAGNGTVNLGPGAQVEYASSTTGTWDAAGAAANTVYGPSGSAISGALTANRNKICRFQYPVQVGDKLSLQYQLPSTGAWVDAENSAYPMLNWPSFQAGGAITSATIGSTDVTVTFFIYMGAGTIYNSTTGAVNWASASFINWRLVKFSPSSPVGFGLAGTDGSAGLYKAGQAPGQATNTLIAAGYVGQVLTASGSAVAGGATSTYANCASITLTSGIWLVSGGISFNLASATAADTAITAISGFSANTTTDHVTGFNAFPGRAPAVADTNSTIALPSLLIRSNGTDLNIGGSTISGSQVVYLKGRTTWTTSAPTMSGTITAFRIA